MVAISIFFENIHWSYQNAIAVVFFAANKNSELCVSTFRNEMSVSSCLDQKRNFRHVLPSGKLLIKVNCHYIPNRS